MNIKIEKLNKFQTLVWIIKNFYFIKILRIMYSRAMMSLCILYIPKLTYMFSINNKLPSIKNRINWTKNPLDDFVFKDSKNFKDYKKKKINEEVLVFFKKESPEFKKYQYKKVKKYLVNWESNCKGKNIFFSTASIAGVSVYVPKKKLPCFYVNPFYYDKDKKPYYIKNTIKKTLYVKSLSGKQLKIKLNPNHIKILKKDKRSKIIFMNHMINFNSSTEPNLGSGASVIIALLKIYKKVSVYGLDMYQKKKIYKKSFFSSVLSLSNHFQHIIYQENHMENLIYQYLYIARLTNDKNFKVHGNISHIDRQKKLIKNLSKIVYKI